jgi:hypothetical protein
MRILEQILKDVQALPIEDQRLLAASINPPRPIEELAAEQGIRLFDFDAAREAAAGIWPEDESIDDFLAFLYESRREETGRDLA